MQSNMLRAAVLAECPSGLTFDAAFLPNPGKCG